MKIIISFDDLNIYAFDRDVFRLKHELRFYVNYGELLYLQAVMTHYQNYTKSSLKTFESVNIVLKKDDSVYMTLESIKKTLDQIEHFLNSKDIQFGNGYVLLFEKKDISNILQVLFAFQHELELSLLYSFDNIQKGDFEEINEKVESCICNMRLVQRFFEIFCT